MTHRPLCCFLTDCSRLSMRRLIVWSSKNSSRKFKYFEEQLRVFTFRILHDVRHDFPWYFDLLTFAQMFYKNPNHTAIPRNFSDFPEKSDFPDHENGKWSRDSQTGRLAILSFLQQIVQQRTPPTRAGPACAGSKTPRSAWQYFGKMLLVFGCIGTDLCN